MISSKEIAHEMRFTFCKKCGSPAVNDDDESGEESYDICPICKTDAFLIQGSELPERIYLAPPKVKPLAPKFDWDEYDRKQLEAEKKHDARIASYIHDTETMGEMFARTKYLGVKNVVSGQVPQPTTKPENPLLLHLKISK